MGAGGPAVTPFYEVMTFGGAAARRVRARQLTSILLHCTTSREVFRKADDSKFHDQRGYFIYDQKNQIVYNSYFVPRTTCVTAEGPAGDTMTLVAPKRGIAESEYMTDNATTTGFTMNISIADDTLTYSQTTGLEIYDNAFAHTLIQAL
ncbi:heme-binding beta-barrel domain-containing protein [Vibrio lentus]|nr:heme-binding beta-barrel domain-containing protein [Vibrio lentus]